MGKIDYWRLAQALVNILIFFIGLMISIACGFVVLVLVSGALVNIYEALYAQSAINASTINASCIVIFLITIVVMGTLEEYIRLSLGEQK